MMHLWSLEKKLKKAKRSSSGRTPTRNYVPCDPPPGVEAVTGFAFQRDVDGVVVARCVVCRVGYTLCPEMVKWRPTP